MKNNSKKGRRSFFEYLPLVIGFYVVGGIGSWMMGIHFLVSVGFPLALGSLLTWVILDILPYIHIIFKEEED